MPKRDFFRRTQNKRYRAGKYRNPYFQHVRKIPWKILGICFGTLVLVVLGLNLMFSSPRLAINNVQINGLEHIDPSQIEDVVRTYLQQRALLVFKASNQFLFSSDKLSNDLEEAFALANVSLGQSNGTLTITVVERTSNLIWESGEGRYVVDLEGIVNRELYTDEEADVSLPIFSDTNDLSIEVGDRVMTDTEIQNVFNFLDYLESKEIGFTKVEVDRLAGKWMSVQTILGFEILFDSVGDISLQVKHLDSVMIGQIDDLATLEYIDVRFGDHVYYK
jgi:cell division septal protein FtsQ